MENKNEISKYLLYHHNLYIKNTKLYNINIKKNEEYIENGFS